VNTGIFQGFEALEGKKDEKNRHDHQRVLHVLKNRASHADAVWTFKLNPAATERGEVARVGSVW
jgi:hypothetical protein